ncbi:hypothetical protein [Fimbriiglobus ruber]|uniref:hypothetical protein n=1 Tax=Fimbriiglobus ruber TaxID=1908690 RepID=UPI000B4BED28|nr:hypothetical protein [Fimbriiglobus ruber]
MTVAVSIRGGLGGRPFFIPTTDGVFPLIPVDLNSQSFLSQVEQLPDLFQDALSFVGRERNLPFEVDGISR